MFAGSCFVSEMNDSGNNDDFDNDDGDGDGDYDNDVVDDDVSIMLATFLSKHKTSIGGL